MRAKRLRRDPAEALECQSAAEDVTEDTKDRWCESSRGQRGRASVWAAPSPAAASLGQVPWYALRGGQVPSPPASAHSQAMSDEDEAYLCTGLDLYLFQEPGPMYLSRLLYFRLFFL